MGWDVHELGGGRKYSRILLTIVEAVFHRVCLCGKGAPMLRVEMFAVDADDFRAGCVADGILLCLAAVERRVNP